MDSRIADHLAEARRRALRGREFEIRLFEHLLAGVNGWRAVWIHAVGGMGKTSLLEAFADRAAAAGWSVERFEARELGAALAQQHSRAPGDRVVWVVDECEELGPLEHDLFRLHLPQLPATARFVFAGRRPPDDRWRRDPGWRSMLQVHELPPLSEDAARALLKQGGVAHDRCEAWIAFTRGHPLALSLASEYQGEAPVTAVEIPEDIVATLLERFIDRIPSPSHREALTAAALVRALNVPMLREVLGNGDAGSMFDWIGGLCFVRRRADGLAVHDLARDAITADARWRDPERFRELRSAVHRHCVRRLREQTTVERFVDLQFITRYSDFNAGLVDPATELGCYEDAVRPEDIDVMAALVTDVEGPASARILRAWLDCQREHFRVFRDASGIAGFMGRLRITGRAWESSRVKDDPVLSATRRFVREKSGNHRDSATVLRWWIQRGAVHRPGPAQNLIQARALFDWACCVDVRWGIVHVMAPDRYRGHFTGIGFVEQADYAAQLSGHVFVPFARDWSLTPFWPWMEGVRPLASMKTCSIDSADFKDAVREALRVFGSDTKLSISALATMLDLRDVEPLRETLRAAIEDIGREPRGQDLQRVLEVTFLSACPGQEVAAERLDLPFGTYRHRLRAAEALLIERLLVTRRA